MRLLPDDSDQPVECLLVSSVRSQLGVITGRWPDGHIHGRRLLQRCIRSNLRLAQGRYTIKHTVGRYAREAGRKSGSRWCPL